jgi:hypothetical protein
LNREGTAGTLTVHTSGRFVPTGMPGSSCTSVLQDISDTYYSMGTLTPEATTFIRTFSWAGVLDMTRISTLRTLELSYVVQMTNLSASQDRDGNGLVTFEVPNPDALVRGIMGDLRRIRELGAATNL